MATTLVFPRRNLPGDSEHWGRVVENRINGAEAEFLQINQGAQADNRSTAASLALLSDQASELGGVISGVQAAQNDLSGAIQDLNNTVLDVQAVQNATPIIQSFFSRTTTFPVTTTWTTRASLAVPNMPGKTCRALVQWNFQGISEPGPTGVYAQTRATYTGGPPTSGIRWVGWDEDFDAFITRQSGTSSDVVTTSNAFTISIQARTTSGTFPNSSQNAIQISVFALYS